MEKKFGSLYDLMKANLDFRKGNPDIVQQFQFWMLVHASHIMDKKTLNFETNSPKEQRTLQTYLETCPEFDYHWTKVNYSVQISLKGEMTDGTFVPGLGHFKYVGPVLESESED